MPHPAAVFAALLLGALPGVAAAQVEVEIHDRTAGRTLPVHWSEGMRYVAGEPRHEYGIRLRNRSGERVLAVVSVDGVNVVSGETASPSQSGYVLDPWQTTTVTGWRKSMDGVAAFYFTALADAYAARTGRPRHVGVIGVAVFRERVPAPAPSESAESAANDASPPGRAAPASPAPEAGRSAARDEAARRGSQRSEAKVAQRLGTGHGRRLDSQVQWTAFERASDTPACVLAFHYDSRRNLVALGVLPPERHARTMPEPFPGAFVPDPR